VDIRITCGARSIYETARYHPNKRKGKKTHIESRLRAQLLGQQGHGDLELHPAVGRALHVLEPLLQTHVPPDGLHHPQADGVELVVDPDGRHLVVDRPFKRLQPRDEPLVALQVGHHLPAARGQPVPPALARVDHAHLGHVQALHTTTNNGANKSGPPAADWEPLTPFFLISIKA
jgi:hypothetical protein